MNGRRLVLSLLGVVVCAGLGMSDAGVDFMGWGGEINAGGTPAVLEGGERSVATEAGETPAVPEGGERAVVAAEAGGTPAIHYDGGTGTVWYVDDDGVNDPGPGDPTISDPDEDGSIDHPFDSIQEGIDAAIIW